ncbi:MAG: hypothetical protein EON57_02790 [Alphaproteobacteria bacterium]|nr:MAG: hypothetical protein EON57_02790 [Alphaproteobacteria bacterium]
MLVLLQGANFDVYVNVQDIPFQVEAFKGGTEKQPGRVWQERAQALGKLPAELVLGGAGAADA